MIKISLETTDLKYFIGIKGTKCYAILNEGIAICKTRLIDTVIDNILYYELSCRLEYNEGKNYFVDVYIDGKLRESNSLTHIRTDKDLDEHLDGESNYNVSDLLMVTATSDDNVCEEEILLNKYE